MIEKLILGTVQLGLPYGINNTNGQPTIENAYSLLNTAYAQGIRCLDTAEAYGVAQEVIGGYHRMAVGQQFSVITKYQGQQSFATGADFNKHFLRNLSILKVSALEAYLFHSFDVYKAFEHWQAMDALQAKGYVKHIGVSVYTNEQAIEVASDKRIKVVQLPFNMLDNYSLRGNVLALLKDSGKEVHIRSVFLQGLFYKERSSLGRLSGLKVELLQLDEISKESKSDIGTLALAYCLRQPLIDKVLIGIETEMQLQQNIKMLTVVNHIDVGLLAKIDQIKVADTTLLNPSNW